jgi:uncharacterized OB-fold protein
VSAADKQDASPTEAVPLWEDSERGVLLTGWLCQRCGERGLPRQRFGCERCGAPGDEIVETKFEARGVLRSFAVIQRHAVWPVPFLMGEVTLDSGHTIHAFLSDSVAWHPGAKVVGQGGDDLRQSYVVFASGGE